jgi:hypothetical protein
VTLVGAETASSRKPILIISNREELTGRISAVDLEFESTGTPHAS